MKKGGRKIGKFYAVWNSKVNLRSRSDFFLPFLGKEGFKRDSPKFPDMENISVSHTSNTQAEMRRFLFFLVIFKYPDSTVKSISKEAL